MIYKESFDLEELTLELYTPDQASQVIYLFDIPEEADLPYDFLEETETACVVITDPASDKNFSIFSPEDPDNQKAHAFLARLYYDIIPEAEDMLSEIAICPEFFDKNRMIFGMNDAALFSLYAAYRTDLFASVAAFEPELKNKAFMDFVEHYNIYKGTKKVIILTEDEASSITLSELLNRQNKETLICPVKPEHTKKPEILLYLLLSSALCKFYNDLKCSLFFLCYTIYIQNSLILVVLQYLIH